jgi:tetratricopeptide (TPR) repeat protein
MKFMQQQADSFMVSRLSDARYLLVLIVLIAAGPATVFAACTGTVGEKAVNDCQLQISADPHDIKARLALATALDKLGRQDEAVKVLDQGINLFRDDAVSRSTLEEKRWIIQQQGKRQANDVTTRVNIIKCTKLKGTAALKACNDGLRNQPENLALLTGRGKALLDQSPPKVIDAIKAYKKALSIAPSNQDIKRELEHAEYIRQKSVTSCKKKSGKSALAACNRGLMKGASDEALIQTRRGELLITLNREKEALKAYRVVQQLEPGNAAAKQAISQLTAANQKPSPSVQTSLSSTSSPPQSNVSIAPAVAHTFSNAPLAPGVTY